MAAAAAVPIRKCRRFMKAPVYACYRRLSSLFPGCRSVWIFSPCNGYFRRTDGSVSRCSIGASSPLSGSWYALLHLAGQSGRQGHANEARYVIDTQLFHHRLAVAAHGFHSEIENHGNFLAGFALDNQPEYLKFTRSELREQRMAAHCL